MFEHVSKGEDATEIRDPTTRPRDLKAVPGKLTKGRGATGPVHKCWFITMEIQVHPGERTCPTEGFKNASTSRKQFFIGNSSEGKGALTSGKENAGECPN